jgi:Domain of unknown function (DUF4845)
MMKPPVRQRGLSLIGLLFWAVVLGIGALVGMKVFPTVNEFYTIQRTVQKVAQGPAGSVAEVRTAFDKQKEIEFSINSISGKDLDVTKENDRVVIHFAYDKQIEIMEPVYLLIKYQGRSK